MRHPVTRDCSMRCWMARFSACRGLEARNSEYARPPAFAAWSISSGSSAWTMSNPSNAAISRIAASTSAGDSAGNSSTPECSKKHLNPNTPDSCSGRRSATLPGTAPPQNPTSTHVWPSAVLRLTSRAATSTVGGMLLSGMSTIVVTPPAAAALVADSKPSHSVRPGSLTCTWESTIPGSSTSSEPSSTTAAARSPRSDPGASTATICPSLTATSAPRSPSGRTARPARTSRSYSLMVSLPSLRPRW